MLMMYLSNYSQLLCDYKEIMRSGTTGSAHSGEARRRLDCYLWRRGDLVFMASGRADLHTKRPGWDLLLCTKIPVTHGCPGVQRLQRTLCAPTVVQETAWRYRIIYWDAKQTHYSQGLVNYKEINLSCLILVTNNVQICRLLSVRGFDLNVECLKLPQTKLCLSAHTVVKIRVLR